MVNKGLRLPASAVGSASGVGAASVRGVKRGGRRAADAANASVEVGECGYEGCAAPLRQTDVDGDDVALTCQRHHDTYLAGYKYQSEQDTIVMHNAGGEFQECFSNAHHFVHLGGEKPCEEGSVNTCSQNYQDSERKFGAWGLQAPLDIK